MPVKALIEDVITKYRSPSSMNDEPLSIGVLVWHLTSCAMCLIMMVAVLWIPATFWVISALLMASIPGLFALLLLVYNTLLMRQIMIWVWAVCALIAVAFTGGATGPMAAWLLMPLVASVAINKRALISLGAALSACTAIIASFLSLINVFFLPGAMQSLALSIFSLLCIVIGLGTALMPALRKRIERAQDAEIERDTLLKMLTQQPCLIVEIDEVLQITGAYGEPLHGFSGTNLLMSKAESLARPQDREILKAALTKAVLEDRSEVSFQSDLAPGYFLHLRLRLGSDGKLYGILNDQTEENKRLSAIENEVYEIRNINQSKTRFLANMSHELRTPLNAVIGFSDIMRQHLFGPLPEKYTEYARLIWDSGQHVLGLINDLLDMSKIEAEKYELNIESFDVRHAIQSALSLVELQINEKNQILKTYIPSHEVTIDADQRAIKQMVLNLLSNATKFTPVSGSINLIVREDDAMLEIQVSDSGQGIASEDLKHIGTPFEQMGPMSQRSGGTGLGLSIVRSLAQLHKGELRIESQIGKGTSASLFLPVIKHDAPLIALMEHTDSDEAITPVTNEMPKAIDPLSDHTQTPENLLHYDDLVIRSPKSPSEIKP